jgi:amino acid transporter
MTSQQPTTSGVFTRASSGMVRQVKTADVFYFGWQTIALSYIVFTVSVWVLYPGSSMELSTLIATLFGATIVACYGMLAAVYPRSGAEYVFLSRSLHPAVGFALSFNFTAWQIFYVGLNGAFLSLYAIQPTLAAIGIQTESQRLIDLANWFGHDWGLFLSAAVAILLVLGIHLSGAGRYFRWQRIATFVAALSLVVTAVVLLLTATGALDFEAHFNDVAGSGAYQAVIDGGRDAGLQVGASFSMTETLKFVLWPAFSLWFAITAVSFSGEVRDVSRGQLYGLLGSVAAMGLTFIVLMALYRGAFGSEFLQAAGVNGTPLEAAPFTPLFTAIAGGNVVLTILMSVWVLTIAFFVLGTVFVYPSRTILAWSIDGMAPRRLSDVNSRFNSPHWALIVCAVGGLGVLWMFVFTDKLGVVSGFLGLALNFLVVCAWSIFFPYVRRELFENSPIAWRVGGIPVLSILGAVSTVAIVPVLWRLVVDSTFTLDRGYAVWGAVITVAAGFVWYYAWRLLERRRGVDVGMQFKEIPVE